MKCAQIIGVTVSETTVEMPIAKASVTENSRKNRPTIPPIRSSGMKAAMSEIEIATTVKPICLAPTIAARMAERPMARLRSMFSIITIASSTTNPTETASAIREILSIEKPTHHIKAHVPESASGTVTPAASVGREPAQEDEDDQHDEENRQAERLLHVVNARPDGRGAVGQDRDLEPGRNPALKIGQDRFDRVGGCDDIGI